MEGSINVVLYKNLDVGEFNTKIYTRSAEWLISSQNNKTQNHAYILLQEAVYGWNIE